ncbi:hypothetical protein, partial [Mesorhizobium sp. M7A.F.Ca.CA.002.09.1.1]|uniref:hypothetical protein n=1 Tax=Mesorhizobium sp. M7A.F.Ca.CA.002.09.1.1 TaxID=2496739 RepID=UPI0019D01F3E
DQLWRFLVLELGEFHFLHRRTLNRWSLGRLWENIGGMRQMPGAAENNEGRRMTGRKTRLLSSVG